MTTNDAYLALSNSFPTNYPEKNLYELVFNFYPPWYDVSLSRGEHGVMLASHEAQTVMAHGYRPFWISWDHEGHITVGEGERIGKSIIMRARDKIDPYVQPKYLLTANNGSQWIFIIETPEIEVYFGFSPFRKL